VAFGIGHVIAKFIGYTDNDWASLTYDKKSTTNYAFTLGSRIFSWASKTLDFMAQSIIGAK